MALALNNLKRVDMSLNKETNQTKPKRLICHKTKLVLGPVDHQHDSISMEYGSTHTQMNV